MLYTKNDKIDSYTVAFPHKQGRYAETYRVKDAAGTTRFLKLIDYNRVSRYQMNDDGGLREVEIAKALHQHNLCQYVASGDIMVNGGQRTYLVTEYVSGETLSQKIARDKELTVYQIKEIARAVLAALDYLHTLPTPIIHNEVSIPNVLLDLAGEMKDLKLIDFGHACFLGQRIGRPDLSDVNACYLAPERFHGVCSVQSDLYAVGVMMYQMLYGMLPWLVDVSRVPEEEKVDAILSARDRLLALPRQDKFELDEQLVNTIVKAISQDVDDRFQSAHDFILAIDGEKKIERPSPRKKRLYNADATEKVPCPVAKKGKGFAAIAGMDDLKRLLQEEVIDPLHHPEEYQHYGVTIPNGMLLYGPPGCGKTFFAKHFAEEVGFNFQLMPPASLKSKYVNASQENIAKMFKEAEENAPIIIFIDEINELVPNRESHEIHEMSRGVVEEMLAQMDRTGEKGIFVIGATNYPQMIDPAMLRAGRLDRKYYVGVPDLSARRALFALYLAKRPLDFGIDYDTLAQQTEDYISADIQLIVNDAARKALRQKSKITMALLQQAIKECRPSLDKNELLRYDKIREQMEREDSTKPARPKIGF